MSDVIEPNQSPLYAVIDLGSNSFHMLITRQLANSVQIVDKVKRKVRLASGLDQNNKLDDAAIARGLECLSFFAERLQDIPDHQVQIVATATLRLAINRDSFLKKANRILGQNIQLLSGEQEAKYIYQGVAQTSCGENNRLVIDIGGASTEIIVGKKVEAKKVVSLDIGCVTFLPHFINGKLTAKFFDNAITAASQQIQPLVSEFQDIGWQQVLSGSGTMQALAEILLAQQHPTIITLDFLYQIRKQLIACKTISAIEIAGLASDRKPVLASGLAILIALFQQLEIKQIQLSHGALREGLLYQMLPTSTLNIRQRSVNSLIERFHIDQQHAKNVLQQADKIYLQVANNWQLNNANCQTLLQTSCLLHEVGLLLGFKQHQQHSAYIIQAADLPGFDIADKQLLTMLVKLYKGDIDHQLLTQSACCQQSASYLLAILRLAVILCRRRSDDVLPDYHCHANSDELILALPNIWLAQHPLIADELQQECKHLSALSINLSIKTL